MSLDPNQRRRATAAALLAVTLTAAAGPTLQRGGEGHDATVPSPAPGPAAGVALAASAGLGGPASVSEVARPTVAPASHLRAVGAVPPAVAASTTPNRGTPAQDDGLSGPPESVLQGVAATAAQPVRVVAQTTDASGRPDWRAFEATTHEQALAAVEAARRVPDVELVTVDREVHALAGTPRYGDPLRSSQWALDTLRGEAAATASTGAGVTVAVLDTGVRGDHEDFAPGTVLPGRSYVSDAYGPVGDVDPHGHGTHVAGIIAAARDNARGVAGLSDATILPMRVLGAGGSGSSYGIVTAVRDAVDMGADVVSMSLGGTGSAGIYDSVVDYARSRGVVVVAAAGNSRQQGDPVNYPGAAPGVLTVAASTAGNATASFSNTGSHVEVAAPGAGILSLGIDSPTAYVSKSGTSMATPYVSAAAAMLLSARPDLTPAQVEAALVSTARDIEAPGRDVQSGAGVIDPVAALQTVLGGTLPAPNRAPTTTPDAVDVVQGSAVTIDVRANDTDPDGDTLTVTSVGHPTAGSATVSGDNVRYTAPSTWTGTDTFTYTVGDGRGATATGRVTVTVTARPNTAPTAASDTATTRQGTSVRIDVLGNDRDAERDPLSITGVGPARAGTTRLSSGAVLYTPSAAFTGVDSFTYAVSDGRGGSATGTVSVTVTAPNRVPQTATDRVTTTRGVPVTVAVLGNDRDPDGDVLTLASVNRPRRGTVEIVDGAVLYTPSATFTGMDSFSYRVSDGRGGHAPGLVTVRVSAPAPAGR